jgi:hypothetical protein
VRSRDPQSGGRLGFLRTEPQRHPLRVFLSYRREDASGHAGRLYDLLASRYGADRVFMDVDAIPLGSEFGETISRAVASCDVLIAVIGRGWLGATDPAGVRRLDDRDDFVRREIESALEQDVVVVPATVQGARLPRAEDLPPSLAPLAGRQGFELSDAGWQDDVGRLVRRLEAVAEARAAGGAETERPAEAPRTPSPRRVVRPVALGVVAILAVLAAVLLLGGGEDGGEAPAGEAGAAAGRRAVTLGSDLRTSPSGERWYCTGSGPDSPACSFVLTRLPEADRAVRAPFDGVVTRWQIVDARGPIRLIVARGELRPGGRSTLERVRGSVAQDVRVGGRRTFPTRLRIARGDSVGLQFSVGAYGNAPHSQGTWLEEWIPPLGPEPSRAIDTSTFEYELLYNASVERDRDGDGFGDVTQDECPDDSDRQEDC